MIDEKVKKLVSYIENQAPTCGVRNMDFSHQVTFINGIHIQVIKRHKSEDGYASSRCYIWTSKEGLNQELTYELSDLEYELLLEAITEYRNKCIEEGKKPLKLELGLL